MAIHIDTDAALHYFKTADPVMTELLLHARAQDTPLQIPTPTTPERYFKSIVSSIIGQQISNKAAIAIRTRLFSALGEITPDVILATDHTTLRTLGLSNQKASYLIRNAAMWDQLPIEEFTQMTDEEIIIELTKLYGVGRWTAEMFLLFAMGRPDVFSYGDFGLMQGLYRTYNLRPHYVRKIKSTVENWSPYRSIASLTLWHTADTQS